MAVEEVEVEAGVVGGADAVEAEAEASLLLTLLLLVAAVGKSAARVCKRPRSLSTFFDGSGGIFSRQFSMGQLTL
jgi:hypothetical protein